MEKLRAADFEVDLRTIQRDLNKLSEVLPLTSDQAKPQGWSWKEHADQFDIPGMEPQVALAFQMAEGSLAKRPAQKHSGFPSTMVQHG